MAYTNDFVDNMLQLLEPEEVNPEEVGEAQEGVEQVDSDSSSDSSTPEQLNGLSTKECFMKFIEEWQSHTPLVTSQWWKADDMSKIYSLLAAP
eukprot:2627728-Amphidinium_carterae.1